MGDSQWRRNTRPVYPVPCKLWVCNSCEIFDINDRLNTLYIQTVHFMPLIYVYMCPKILNTKHWNAGCYAPLNHWTIELLNHPTPPNHWTRYLVFKFPRLLTSLVDKIGITNWWWYHSKATQMKWRHHEAGMSLLDKSVLETIEVHPGLETTERLGTRVSDSKVIVIGAGWR